MKIKIINEWNAALWAEYQLTLTPQQQQQVEAHRLTNPEATDTELMDLLDIEYTDVKDSGKLTDGGSKVYYDDYKVEIEDDEIYNAETKTFSTSERL